MILHEGTIQVGDVQLFYKAGGPGSLVIVLHGGPGMDRQSFLPQFERLADHFHVILYDQRASGRSSGYPYETTARMSVYVKDLEGLHRPFRFSKCLSSVSHLVGSWQCRMPLPIRRPCRSLFCLIL